MIDVHVSLGYWPFQPGARVTPAALEKLLRSESVREAWVSPVEAILAPDPGSWNRKLFSGLKKSEVLRPVGVVNPALGNWCEEVDNCLENPALRGIKIFPNYHSFATDDAKVAELADRLSDAGLPLIIQVRVEDERNQYPLMKVPGVKASQIKTLANARPQARIVCLGLYLREIRELLSGSDNVWADTAFAESFETIPQLLEHVPAERLLFGSHAPWFSLRSAILKVARSDVQARIRRRIGHQNALSLLKKPARIS